MISEKVTLLTHGLAANNSPLAWLLPNNKLIVFSQIAEACLFTKVTMLYHCYHYSLNFPRFINLRRSLMVFSHQSKTRQDNDKTKC